eukprot:CAMPEP_0117419290 /NCGR_PEP_ID=MMETSP0758-20121206/886_1 /TAXON_ID=63605 /ORGANISM="Percolomonas cosmopolitus, Strain AE-1 (ATCC 50343)" /LENGTH=741 /DNA_ID=CAMNT_0005200275 /DNA_START=576 /DNA_END=2797 /DNA_ORIENTATION=-
MSVPRIYLGAYSGAYPENYTQQSYNDFDNIWDVVWDSFNSGMHEFEHHVHYSYYFEGGTKMIGIMGGSHEKHPIVLTTEREAGSLGEGETPLHNDGFDHSSILRFRSWPSLTKPGYLEGNDVINKTTGQVGKLTLNITYTIPDHFNEIKEIAAANKSKVNGWTTTHLWFCTNPEIECMQMTGYYSIVRSPNLDFMGYHYLSYESAGLSKVLYENSPFSEVSFIFEPSTLKMIASSAYQTFPTYYFDAQNNSLVHTTENYGHLLVRSLTKIVLAEFADIEVNTVIHHNVYDPKRGNLLIDLAHMQDEWGLDWWIVVVASEISMTLFQGLWGAATVGFSLLMILFSIVIGIILSITVHRPLAMIARDMNKVATLSLEDIDMPKSYSKYDEVLQLQHAFKVMIAKLREYKTFLPSAIFEAEFQEVETAGDVSEIESECNSNATGSSANAMANRFSSTNLTKRKSGNVFGPRLEELTQTVLAVRLHYIDSILSKVDHKLYISLHGEYLSNVSEICLSHGASMERFSYNEFIFSFSDPISACLTSFKLVKRLDMLSHIERPEHEKINFSYGIGIAHGSAYRGVLGNADMRQRTLFGRTIDFAKLLAETNRKWSTNILIDEALKEAINKKAMTRPITEARLPYEIANDTCFELIPAVEQKYDEWFYELKTKSQIEAYDIYQAAYSEMLEESYEHAQKLFSQFQDIYPDDLVVQQMIKKCTANIIRSKADGLTLNIRRVFRRRQQSST